MGRGKNSRRRTSLDGPAHAPHAGHCSAVHHHHQGGGHGGDMMMPISLNNAPTNREEIVDAIEFHWKNLSLDLKQFLLHNPRELSLRRFVDFWTSPLRCENTSPNIAASICGCSWYLALNYMSIGKMVEARALILNGCFLQQCYNKPIEEIADIARSVSGESFRARLPFFSDGLLAISTEERMQSFLRNKVSSDYQRRMSFATQTTQTKNRVQDYVNQISSDWNDGGAVRQGGRRNVARRRRATAGAPPDESCIQIRLVDDATKGETRVLHGANMTLKSLFKKYAEDRNLSLRQLRFSYKGRTLFLSSVGQRTPRDLGIKHLDSITVVDSRAPSSQRKPPEEGPSSSDESKASARSAKESPGRKGGRGRRVPCRRASWAGPEVLGEEERIKLKHSRQLSRVFSEVAPRFERIRQRLNALNLECTPRKARSRRTKPVAVDPLPFVSHPCGERTGGKAGVSFYAIHVGAVENLYNTQKFAPKGQKTPISIDLHGRTREEALSDLNSKLPEWIDIAMRGAHPFMIRVVIVCGGGNQILSEAVEGWIKGNENVARAPQVKYSRRRSI